MCTHLQRRGGRYFIRRVIPADLREHYGKREITKALGTSDRKEAVLLCRRVGLELDDDFQRVREHGIAQTTNAPRKPVERLQSDIEAKQLPTQHPQTKIPPAVSKAATGAVTLSDLADRWEVERKPDWRSVAAAQRAVRRFTEMVGKILPRDITRAHAVLFKDKMLESGQTGVNTNKQIGMLNVVLNYGVANGELEYNPANGIKVQVKRSAKDARHPFSLRDLQTMFATLPAYSGGYIPKHIGKDAAYWIPLLALFYGARREELCQLKPEDIYEEVYVDETGKDNKAWVLRITDSDDGQQVKNIGSVRRVPVHDELIARGFLEFVEAQRGKPRLFSQLTQWATGEEGAGFGKWFSQVLRRDCGITDPKLVFHSFRHSFKDHCRALEISEEVSDALSGHASGKVSRRYGGLAFPLRPLVEAVKKYRVPGLVLPD